MSREMTNSEAIFNLNHIYGIVSPDIQRSLDLAIKALEDKPQGDLISRSALKDAINTYDTFACLPDCKLYPVRELEHPEMFVSYIHVDDIIKAIDNAPTVPQVTICCENASKEEIEDFKQELENVLASIEQGKWIPVSERLPMRNGVYTITRIIEGTYLIDASYFDGQNTWHRDVCVNHGRPYLNDVIAWQPRPEPYKKGGAE